MAVFKRARSIVATIIVGGMLGFLVPTFVSGLQDPQLPPDATTGETITARRFMVALLSNDQNTLRQVSVQPTDAIEAARLGVTDASVTSLTFLGSSDDGGVHFNQYAVEFTNPGGQKILRGFRVATVGQFAILADPPEPIAQ
ncbi:MAG TPA: hypothetical protein VH813_03810 [Candidatus Limnocylindrales bacterium]|jgi:hypothetical protein